MPFDVILPIIVTLQLLVIFLTIVVLFHLHFLIVTIHYNITYEQDNDDLVNTFLNFQMHCFFFQIELPLYKYMYNTCPLETYLEIT